MGFCQVHHGIVLLSDFDGVVHQVSHQLLEQCWISLALPASQARGQALIT